MRLLDYNRQAWNESVQKGNRWTIPVTAKEIARAREGDWSIVLTPQKKVPRDWFPASLQGRKVLCLAGGGGQQGPILAAAGAEVIVFDLSPGQLGQDRKVAESEGLNLKTVEGDMRDLSTFSDNTFDLIVHPCSNCFAPDIAPVWREALRVLKPGGSLLSGFINPLIFMFDFEAMQRDELVMRFKLPYSDVEQLSQKELALLVEQGEPMTFGHTLSQQIGGQLAAGFLIRGFYEDVWTELIIDQYTPTMIATWAIKPSG